MPLHTKKEFAAMCGMTTSKLSIYALPDRRKIIYNGDYIDSSVEPNISFLQKWRDKNRDKIAGIESEKPAVEPKKLRLTRPLTKKEIIEDEQKWQQNEPIDPEITGTTSLDAKKLRTQILKMEKEIEKLNLNNQKAMGQVVPVDLMDSVFLQERQSVLVESKNTLQDILTIFAKRRDLTAAERADISTEFTDRLNEMMKRSAEATQKAIDEIVKQFSVKRGKGERT
jgi:hypothetical protein